MKTKTASRSPLRHRTFAAIWAANLVSNFGSLIQSVGAAWLMMSLAASTQMVALVQASTTLPIMLFALLAGALADNFNRRYVMLIAQSIMASASILLSCLAFEDMITPWSLLELTFVIGCGQALNAPAWQASVGDQVPREDVPAAVALNSLGFSIARSVGPGLGGVIVAIAGASAAFAINTLSYFGLIAVLLRTKQGVGARTLPRESIIAAMAAGLRYTAMSPGIRIVLLRGFTVGLAGSSVWALMPLVARILIGGGPLTFGLLSTAFGIGAVAGAFVSTPLRARLGSEWVLRIGTLAFALSTLIAAVSPWRATTMLGLALGGLGWVTTLSTLNVAVQMSTSRWVVARVLAIYQMTTFGGMALGSALWGFLGERIGIAHALEFSAGGLIVAMLIGFRYTLSGDVAAADLDPAPARTTASGNEVTNGRSGRVITTVEYQIDPAEQQSFALAMRDQRRVRMRDGAYDWSLMQDIADPWRWIERYHSRNWIEHLRRRTRITHSDRDISDRVRAFHRRAEPPIVSHFMDHPRGEISGMPQLSFAGGAEGRTDASIVA